GGQAEQASGRSRSTIGIRLFRRWFGLVGRAACVRGDRRKEWYSNGAGPGSLPGTAQLPKLAHFGRTQRAISRFVGKSEQVVSELARLRAATPRPSPGRHVQGTKRGQSAFL